MVRSLKVLWQLPQAILGFLVYLFCNKVVVTKCKEGIIVVSVDKIGGLSLYPFVFINRYSGDNTLKHELGHVKQSLMLGWLYLIMVGIPSFVRATVWFFDKDRNRADYYKGYPEKWADRLGGVKRE
jgi:hypothetical protein